ncbi:ABC transporter ATP-binding protein [Pseudohaliea rubra]|uniref:ABC transporter ATP-binding protein n=1 Tax=Pseudohaliea rubra DSM 19751 TaxID=1265313 RepID=A0A095VSK0_9GAMM|nr:ABC transporter ATP-binding protein [Pseudohaliea rubra]KGE04053.1 ABC transporter ATP-binding protein [Pseudohaliea rubra DSM 19751]
MIDVQHLSRRYGMTTAVDDVSFTISDQAIIGLLGHNGAGKTTMMKMLSGYLEPSAGSIHIGGHNLDGDSAAVQRGLGYLPENLPIYPDMLVADYLDYAATLKGIGRGERPRALRRAIDATSLGDRLLDPIGKLSRGYRQRVGVAQAILGEPSLLILDEPTNGLDPAQTAQMRALIRDLARGATVILSTHIMQEVDALCERVLVLAGGRLVLDEHLTRLREDNTLILRAGTDAADLAGALGRLPQVLTVTADGGDGGDGGQCFTLALHPGTERDTAAGNIARCVLDSGARLYQLAPRLRDLDRVLRELTAPEGARHD